jgi:hypothetical protein
MPQSAVLLARAPRTSRRWRPRKPPMSTRGRGRGARRGGRESASPGRSG